ncbi:Nse1 non-SMC component of SMC5-6 complex-domain-containing protein [Radiomyces spectabilis]|uniref:Nse1 non-SMC component of SMC5-6 complex-domain-containing protein n=1 Tax=Radiomyces spectabilis TaxID=64574 RepID=UPI00221EEB02|nr:Nse1 non-SMC component of SMC5-6 complex-domain-containing protein [Radiomyces spectabilis]KAI8374425.1 Nse1 non-SMC component of SMC5-6 complex-domain-containing protein [Radiomyces spectabilis]
MLASQERTAYDDRQRLFLQSLLSYKILDEDKAMELYRRVCQLTEKDQIDFAEFIASINKEINEMDIAIRRSHNQRDGQPILALVNTKEDEIAQIATHYTANEISYFRQLIELIMMSDDEDYAVQSMTALQLGQKMKPLLTQKETEELLDRFVEDGWLYLTPTGVYTMDNRALLELQAYLRQQFGDVVKECLMCFEVITMGERCELQNCSSRIHRHCADGYFRTASSMVCPMCQTRWSRSNTFGKGLPP